MNPRKIDLNCGSCSCFSHPHTGMTQEEAEQQLELLTDIIEMQAGKQLRELHPEMSVQELAERGFQLIGILDII